MPNQPVLRVLRIDDLWVKVYVPETELYRFKLGQEADVTIDGLPNEHFAGTIRFIDSESEFTPRNVQSADDAGTRCSASRSVLPIRRVGLSPGWPPR